MKQFALITVIVALLLGSCAQKRAEERILVFSKTEGFRHSSIEAGKLALLQLGQEHGMVVDTTEDASFFTEEKLKTYSAVVFLNTTQDVLDFAQQADFERYIQSGGGFVGIHAATDTEYHWPWYGKLVGAYFKSHPKVQEARLQVVEARHESTAPLPADFQHTDEWYNFRDLNPDITPLVMLDETSYEGGENGDYHPIAWYHEYDGGRSWYTNLGHREETFQDEHFLAHLLGGIRYAIGENLENDYRQARSLRKPDDSRFVTTVLDEYLDEPLELEILPNLDVLYIQRKGQLMLYEQDTRMSKPVGEIDVHTQYEDGLLGLALDPNYVENNWIYLYYSPAGPESIQRLSRFSYVNDSLYNESETMIFEVPVQRLECCHTGGSIEFGSDGLLYLSTGDDTNPFETGYAPINELPDRFPWDAQKSSANPNDLRGKVLRIKPQKDGSYTIPEGNLFPADGSEGRPEIYVMGCRNPYRISIDPRKGYLYWGDVGPDARKDSTRGPRGYDEVNQAKRAGFFGWPLFIADNQPYQEVDFATNQYLGKFDPATPVNNSPNNTGIQQLPPAQEAFIYYPYAKSKEFPLVGEGGRNAMAGPVFYHDLWEGTPSQFPDYYDEKVFIYDFMRDWVMAVTLDENDNFSYMEPFLPELELSSPMDMKFGPDGALYILEYGTRWFSINEDARLIRIDYSEDNRAPIPQLAARQSVGAAPFKVDFSAADSYDHDGDTEFSYEWTFEPGVSQKTDEPEVSYTYETPGIYQASVKVTDPQGKSAFADLEVRVGNEPPSIELAFEGNRSFFWSRQAIDYEVVVSDQEDGSTANGSLNPDKVTITFDYLDESEDLTLLAQGHQAIAKAAVIETGKTLVQKNGCIACHAIDKQILGPAYRDVALRYQDQADAVEYLGKKIISGGSGNWGGQAMTAFPQLKKEEAETMAMYVLSLADETEAPKGLPLSGTLRTNQHKGLGENGSYTFYVSYTDNGGEPVGSLSSSEVITLRSARLSPEVIDDLNSTASVRGGVARFRNDGEYLQFPAYDLTGLGSIRIRYAASQASTLEIYLNDMEGPAVASEALAATGGNDRFREVVLPLNAQEGFHQLFIKAVNPDAAENQVFCRIQWLDMQRAPGI